MNMQSDFTLRPVLAGTDPATQYADLLMYGVVGLAAPVETFAPVLEAATWWVEGTPKATPAFHEISSKLRNVVLKTGAPVADRRLLGAMVALGQEKNHPEHCVVVLPMPQTPESIAEHLTRTATKEIQHRIQMLREHRRQQLGLSARLEASQIDDAIYRAFIVPSAEVAFAHLFPEAPAVRISTTAPLAQTTPKHFARLAPQADEPLSSNVFALAMRTGFHGHTSKAVKPWLQLSPFQFGLQARRANAPSEVMQRIALSTPQLCLLSTIGLKGNQNA
jgi:hypothetical protein